MHPYYLVHSRSLSAVDLLRPRATISQTPGRAIHSRVVYVCVCVCVFVCVFVCVLVVWFFFFVVVGCMHVCVCRVSWFS